MGLSASAFRTEVYRVHAILREMWELDKKTVREVGITASKDNNVLVDPAALRSLTHDGAAGRYVGKRNLLAARAVNSSEPSATVARWYAQRGATGLY